VKFPNFNFPLLGMFQPIFINVLFQLLIGSETCQFSVGIWAKNTVIDMLIQYYWSEHISCITAVWKKFNWISLEAFMWRPSKTGRFLFRWCIYMWFDDFSELYLLVCSVGRYRARALASPAVLSFACREGGRCRPAFSVWRSRPVKVGTLTVNVANIWWLTLRRTVVFCVK